MAKQAATGFEDGLRRDIAILSTLAHLHCATVSHLHALCFPFHTLATARLTLRYLAEANFIARSMWRLKRETDERGQVWVLTAKGIDLLQRYVPHVPPLARISLARPSTAVEHEEWRIRLQVRTLLVRLVLEARQTRLLHAAEVQFPWSASWPTAWGTAPLPVADACIIVTWQPAERKASDWLPWIDPTPAQGHTVHHPIYLERTQAHVNLLDLLPAWSQHHLDEQPIPLVIVRDDRRCQPLVQQLQAVADAPVVRLTNWAGLDGGLVHARWWDEHGATRGLMPPHELRVA